MENILKLNLLGKRFHIPSRIVADYPQTLLGNNLLLSKYYRRHRDDYYLERSPLLFPYILTYYTLGQKIFCPHHIPRELLLNECEFFQLTKPSIYHELHKTATYQYFSRKKTCKKDYFIHIVPVITGLVFLITSSMETLNNKNNNNQSRHSSVSWSLSYFLELFSTLSLTSMIFYQVISGRTSSLRENYFLFNLFSTILSIIIIACQNLMNITNYHRLYILILIFKTFRLLIIIVHLRVLRIVMLTFIQRFESICILVFINIIIIGSLSETAFAFERRQQEDQNNQTTMKTHLDAFWWATSLSFTIGFGQTDAHSTLTTIGRFCSYMLTFFGLLFNGLILQELIKGFLQINRQDRRDQ